MRPAEAWREKHGRAVDIRRLPVPPELGPYTVTCWQPECRDGDRLLTLGTFDSLTVADRALWDHKEAHWHEVIP